MYKHYKTAEALANFLDNRYNFLGLKFGVAPVIGIIPGIGDLIDVGLSLYIVWIALQLSVPTSKIVQMFWNILINFIIGSIPIIGEATYILRRVNLKNFQILKQYAPPRIVEGQVI
jgi:hypothetical protein